MFQNPIIVHDENFALLASTDDGLQWDIWEYDGGDGTRILAMDVLNDFKVNPDYQATMNTRGPMMFPAATFGYQILYQNLYYRRCYRGRICVSEMIRPIRSSDYYLLNYFSGVLLDAFRRGKMNRYRQTLSLSRYLVRFMERENVDETELEKVVKQYGWTVHDSYFCACLMLEDRDIHTNSVQYYCTWFSEEIPEVCAFSYEKSIVVLVNASSSGLTMADFRNRIAIMLRESLMKMGISSVCTDLTKFYYMHHQAVCAREIGKRKQETFWSYCFDDYQQDFIFQHALQEFPAEFLCSQELFTLKEYDKDHTSELYKTLKIYLENDRNLARTAEILDIHRSTLLYRIGRIKDLIKADMESPKVRFRLWGSYRLMEEIGE